MANKKAADKKSKAATSYKRQSHAAEKKQSTLSSVEKPIRRELTACIFFLIGIFLTIGYFNTDGIIIKYISDIVKGLIGWGFWIAPPALFISGYILFTHRGRPVELRVFCALAVPVLFGAIAHFIAASNPDTNGIVDMIASLYEEGKSLKSGGAIGGLLEYGLYMTLGAWGAIPVLLIGFVACIIKSFDFRLKSVFTKKQRLKYSPEMYEQPKKAEQPADFKSPDEKTASFTFPREIPLYDETAVSKDRRRVETRQAGKTVRQSQYFPDLSLGKRAESIEPFGAAKNNQRPELRNSALNVKKQQATGERQAECAEYSSEGPVQTGALTQKQMDVFSNASLNSLRTQSTVKPLVVEEAAQISGVKLTDSEKLKKPLDRSSGKKSSRKSVEAEAAIVAAEIESNLGDDNSEYKFPPVTLLRSAQSASISDREEIEKTRLNLENALHSFGISSSVINTINGPTVTRYDIKLKEGVKLSRVTNLAGDLALALGVMNVRIAPVPDEISTVGIEVPNKIVSTVYLRDLIESREFNTAKSKLTFALGKDIGSNCMVGNISKLPHLLIAGTTGSGKSVCMNSLILSILYKARPDEVKFIMVDPKMVELGVYNGIPHLYVPVVTDPKKAAGALQWSVIEMLKRYRMFSEAGVRDLDTFNKLNETKGEPTLPKVVIVIDELADLMMVSAKEVEESICRVAQMGRAAGMHLVVATQRPSADVITGLMKANIPSRIAFAVSSSLESRIILDQVGADKLVGMGDMLYSPVGLGKPVRIQGAFVSDDERENVISFIKENSVSVESNTEIAEYMNKAMEANGKNSGGNSEKNSSAKNDGPSSDYDDMLPQAVEVVLEMKQCSVSMLQRRLKLGYSRAARVVDQLEELGIVGPYEGAKPRSVIIDRNTWQELKISLGYAAEDDLTLAAELSECADTEE